MTFRLRQKLLTVACAAVLVIATSASGQAGLIPWLVDSVFGPRCSPYAQAYGQSYSSYYQGYGAGYGNHGASYSTTYGNCPTSIVPNRGYYTPQVSRAPQFINSTPYYSAGYARPCLPFPRLFPPILPALFGGCRPCGPSYGGYGYPGYGGCGYGSSMLGCPPYGYGGCPLTLPAASASSTGKSGGWQKRSPKTYADESAAGGAEKVDRGTLRPPRRVEDDADAGPVIRPSKPAPLKVENVTGDKQKTEADKKTPEADKKTPEADKPAGGTGSSAATTSAWRVLPARTRLARRHVVRRLPSVVIARQVVRVHQRGRGTGEVAPVVTIAGH